MTPEEKAKRYDEALERARKLQENSNGMILKKWLWDIFPELKESEDEKIRKWLITQLELKSDVNNPHDLELMILKSIVWLEKQVPACLSHDDEIMIRQLTEYFTTGKGLQNTNDTVVEWLADIKRKLEKQGRQDNNEDEDILHRFSFYSYKDEPNILYLAGLYVNDKYRNKGIGTKILEVADEVAKSLNCHAIRLKTKKDSNTEKLYQTHGYNSLVTEEKDEIWLEKQGEPKNIDSEDEKNINSLCELLTDLQVKSTENEIKHGTNSHSKYYHDIKEWLKSLKDRIIWSRKKEQLNCKV